jgi:nucleoid-associated protein YgaU
VLDDKHKPFTTLKIEIRYADGREMWTPVRAVVWDDQLDLCIIESSADLPSLTQLSETDLNVGSSVLLVGSPRGVPIAQFEGSVTSRFYNATVRTATRIPFDHGDSGGPFFCARTRKVVGVAVAGVPKDGDLDHNIGLFVPMAGVASFLEQNARVKVEPMAIAIEARPTTIPVAKPIPMADVQPKTAAVPAVAVNPKPAPRAPVFIEDDSKSEVVELRAPRTEKSVARDPLPTPAPQIKTVAAAPAPVIQPVQMRLDTGNQPAIVKAVYTVQLGDNLTVIAKRHNVSIRSLLTANELKDPNVLKPGMTLNIP